uniref:Uncharacterized protein n=1 Tax=Micrurus corallinus TaxID=54390 RepID=A0A2D4H4L2_MICCO
MEVWLLQEDQPGLQILHKLLSGQAGDTAIRCRQAGHGGLVLGFFKRARYEKAKLPQYHAIKIPRQERQLFHEEKTGTITKKDWVTSWSGDSDGHVPVST